MGIYNTRGLSMSNAGSIISGNESELGFIIDCEAMRRRAIMHLVL